MDELHAGITLPKLTGTSANLNKIVKYFQCPVFYKKELALWKENPEYKGTSLHVFLYYNRLTYLGKKPNELSDVEILRGLSIAGVLRGYTVFNTKIMTKVLKKYDVKSMYDPCAGWGERMLCCFYNNVSYYGVDVNEALHNGYTDMMEYFDMERDEYQLRIGDSAAMDVYDVDVDMVFTCPPYHNIEVYSDVGAENKSYFEFLAWWRDVVQNSLFVNPEYFVFQINQKYKSDMLNVVLESGFDFVEEIVSDKIASSHFTRSKGGVNRKREYESLIVCRRSV